MPNYFGDGEFRLLSKRLIIPETGCWRFTGTIVENGYGQMLFEGKKQKVHRISAYLYLGFDLKDTKTPICHKDDICKYRDCFNPDHIYVGSNSSNMVDRHKAGKDNNYNGRKKFCKNGHEMTPDNVRIFVKPNGEMRICKKCKRERDIKYLNARNS